jgi:hypothetical protein
LSARLTLISHAQAQRPEAFPVDESVEKKGTTECVYQEIPEGVQAAVDAINHELGEKRAGKKGWEGGGQKNFLPSRNGRCL